MITRMLISSSKVRQVEAVIEKINRKAERWGFPPFELRVTGEPRLERIDMGDPYGVLMVSGVPIEIEGDLLKFGNYALMGQVKYDSDGTVKSTRSYRDFLIPAEDVVNRNLCCEHCNTVRARNHYFYIKDESDPAAKVKRIGSTCVEDVLGYSPATVASFAQLVHDAIAMIEAMEADGDVLESMREGGRGGSQDLTLGVRTDDAIALCIDVVKAHGYLSVSRAQEMALSGTKVDCTAARLYERISAKDKPSEEHLASARAYLAGERQRHEALCASGGGLTAFEARAMAAMLSETINADRLPLIAYAASQVLRQERVAKASNSHAIGRVGESLDVDLQVRFRHAFSTMYGMKYLVVMADTNDNQVAWFTTNPQGLKVDDIVRLSAKVEKHEEYRGVMQTVISRPTLHAVLGRDDFEGEWPCESEWVQGLSRELLREAGFLNLSAVKRLVAMGADLSYTRDEMPGVQASALDAAMITLFRGGVSLGEQPKSVQSLVKFLHKSGCRLEAEWDDEELAAFGFGAIGIKLDSVRKRAAVQQEQESALSL